MEVTEQRSHGEAGDEDNEESDRVSTGVVKSVDCRERRS